MNIATRLRIDSVRSTTEAGSGHPSTCCSAAEIMAALFFGEMRYDPRDPAEPRQRSLRAVERTCGADSLRRVGGSRNHQPRGGADAAAHRFGSRRPSDAAAAVGRRRHRLARSGTLRGCRHRVERAAHRLGLPHLCADGRWRNGRRVGLGGRGRRRAHERLDSLCAIIDVNALGQSQPTQWQHDMNAHATRWSAFGWHTIVIDGHDLPAVLDALEQARRTKGRPTVILARTLKGKGISFIEGQERLARQAVEEGRRAGQGARRAAVAVRAGGRAGCSGRRRRRGGSGRRRSRRRSARRRTQLGDSVATREAYGTAIARLGRRGRSDRRARCRRQELDVQRQVRAAVSRIASIRCFIAEQVMIGAAMGLAARGAIPFPSTFAAFLTPRLRLHPDGGDQQRQHQDGRFACRRVDWRGRSVADGARRPRDDARATEHRPCSIPCDAVSTERLLEKAAYHHGPGLHADVAAEDAGDLRPGRALRARRAEGAAPERERMWRR